MSFKWEWVWVPAACLIVFWCLSVVQPACRWDDVLGLVANGSEYSRLAILGVLVTAVVAVARVLHKSSDE